MVIIRKITVFAFMLGSWASVLPSDRAVRCISKNTYEQLTFAFFMRDHSSRERLGQYFSSSFAFRDPRIPLSAEQEEQGWFVVCDGYAMRRFELRAAPTSGMPPLEDFLRGIGANDDVFTSLALDLDNSKSWRSMDGSAVPEGGPAVHVEEAQGHLLYGIWQKLRSLYGLMPNDYWKNGFAQQVVAWEAKMPFLCISPEHSIESVVATLSSESAFRLNCDDGISVDSIEEKSLVAPIRGFIADVTYAVPDLDRKNYFAAIRDLIVGLQDTFDYIARVYSLSTCIK